MEENLNIFGKNLGEIGSLDKNLVLRTKGQVYIRFGRKYIELLDNKGNLNVKIPKFIFKVNSESEMKSNGIYLLDDNVYVYYDGDIILLTGTESEFVSYAIELNLTQEQINIALNNIGLTFNSIDEALQTIDEGIFFVGDSIYYTKDGEYVELTFTLNYPLKDINEAELTRYPQGNYQTIVFINGRWVYSSIVTKEEFNSLEEGIDLNTPLKEINEASTLRTLPEVPFTEPSAEGEETPTPTEGEETPTEPLDEEECSCESDNFSYAIVYKNEKQWAYERIVPYEEFSKCCKMILEKLEELEEATKKYTVTWLNKDGSVYATTTVTKGNTAVSPGNPTLKHWRFLEWLYDNSPIEEDIEILSKWKYIPPIVHLKCEPSIIGSEGGEVIVSYWVEWDGDIILNDITVEGIVDKINYIIEENYYIEDDKIKRKITVSESSYSTMGKISFKASFMGEEGTEPGMGMVYAETVLIQRPAGAIELPEFDLMKFSAEWTYMVDSIPSNSYWYGKEEGTDFELKKEIIDDVTCDVLYEKINNELVVSDLVQVWIKDSSSNKYINYLMDVSEDSGKPYWENKRGDLDVHTVVKGTNIIINDFVSDSNNKLFLDDYGAGYIDRLSISGSRINETNKIIVRKDKTMLFDRNDNEITKETIEEYNLNNSRPADKDKDIYNLYQYLAWSGDNTYSGGEYTVINFKKILNNTTLSGLKAIFIYISFLWAISYNGDGNFNISYDIYRLNDDEKGLISLSGEYNFEEEDDSVENITNTNDNLNKLLGLHVDPIWKPDKKWELSFTKLEYYGDPVATLYYDLNSKNILFLRGYYTEEDIYGSSTSGESFIWTEPKSNPESSSEEEQNDNN